MRVRVCVRGVERLWEYVLVFCCGAFKVICQNFGHLVKYVETHNGNLTISGLVAFFGCDGCSFTGNSTETLSQSRYDNDIIL